MQNGPVFKLRGYQPDIDSSVFIAPTAAVIGQVTVLKYASIWFGSVVRGDEMPIYIGRRSNLQDGVVLHTTGNMVPMHLGDDVVIGHGAILHGCTIGDRAMVGIGATILDGAVIENDAIIAAGSLVPPGTQVPAGQLWLGNPAKFRRPIKITESAFVQEAVKIYQDRARDYLLEGIGLRG